MRDCIHFPIQVQRASGSVHSAGEDEVEGLVLRGKDQLAANVVRGSIVIAIEDMLDRADRVRGINNHGSIDRAADGIDLHHPRLGCVQSQIFWSDDHDWIANCARRLRSSSQGLRGNSPESNC